MDGKVTVTMSYETALNIRGLVKDRLRQNDQAVRDNPDLPVDMPPSTRDGYESFLAQVQEHLDA